MLGRTNENCFLSRLRGSSTIYTIAAAAAILLQHHLRVLGRRRTSDNLDQLAGDDGLSGAVEQDLELIDHVAGVLGGVVHGVAAGGLLASVALSQSPVEAVGQSVLAQVGQDLVVDFEGGEVGCVTSLVPQNYDDGRCSKG
jgi:hypothetical protein